MEFRYHTDPETGLPHIYDHPIAEDGVRTDRKTTRGVSQTPTPEGPMSEQKFPPGWDAERVKKLIDHYDQISEGDLEVEDEAATEEHDGQTVIAVPNDLLPAIRKLLADHKSAS